jgi:quercetin dioxygenase-like cupin family protein
MSFRHISVLPILLLAEALGTASAQSSTQLFAGTVSVRKVDSRARRLHVSVRRWELDAEENDARTIPILAFSVMTVSSGRVETTIDGKATVRSPGDFWVAKAGSQMKVRVLSESAILDATMVSP